MYLNSSDKCIINAEKIEIIIIFNNLSFCYFYLSILNFVYPVRKIINIHINWCKVLDFEK